MTLAIVAIWIVQGFGFVHLLLPKAAERPLLHVVFAAWCGLISNLVISVTLYFAVPGVTIGQLAWPVTIVLAVTSVGLTVTRARPRLAFDRQTAVIAACVLVAIALVLRPLVDQSHLGFFESFNGEFTNYAAMADAAQFHDSSFTTVTSGGFAMASREGIAGVVCATMATLTHQPALWLIEPFSAALAAVAFASLGALFQLLLVRRQAGKLESAIAGLVYVSLIWSTATTFFWTASFISQFMSLAIWLPTVLLLAERPEDDRITTVVLGGVFGVLLMIYWEMFLPNIALLGAFQLARARRGSRVKALASFGSALVIALIVANRFSFMFVRKATTVSTAGWDMFGPHKTVLRFAANLLGFTTAYNEPARYSRIAVVLVLVALACSALYSAIRAWREPDPVLRGLFHFGWLFFAGLALAFALVIKRGPGTNYVATKVWVGYGSLAYVGLALGTIDLARWLERRRAKLAVIPLVLVLLAAAIVTRGAYRYAKIQHRVPLYLDTDGEALRDRLHGRRPLIAGEQYSTDIVGRFFLDDRNVFAIEPTWPGTPGTFAPGSPVVVVGDGKLSSVKGITGNYLPTWWLGKLVLFEAFGATP
jgi:hypothetical protein